MDALAVPLVGAECVRIKFGVVGGVIAVDVGVFENVALRVESPNMANRVAYYVKSPRRRVCVLDASKPLECQADRRYDLFSLFGRMTEVRLGEKLGKR